MQLTMEIAFVEEFYEAKAFKITNQGFKLKKVS